MREILIARVSCPTNLNFNFKFYVLLTLGVKSNARYASLICYNDLKVDYLNSIIELFRLDFLNAYARGLSAGSMVAIRFLEPREVDIVENQKKKLEDRLKFAK
jgi:hypothetical protein